MNAPPAPPAPGQAPPSVGLHIIAKDGAGELPSLLASIELAFDQVVLVDTGSKDNTVEVFTEWAEAEVGRRVVAIAAGEIPDHGLEFHKVGHFDWIDDFAAARNFADTLLDTDWASWADCDDVISLPGNLRRVAAMAPPEIAAYIVGYNYGQDPLGNSLSYLKRERLVRTPGPGWINRVHEAQDLASHGGVDWLPPDVVEWVHQKPITTAEAERGVSSSNARNLKILRRWAKDEPRNARVLAYLGTESAIAGRTRRPCRGSASTSRLTPSGTRSAPRCSARWA